MLNPKITGSVRSQRGKIHLTARAFPACVALAAALALNPPAAATVPPPNLTEMTDDFGQRFAESELVAQVQITGVHRDVDRALSEPGMVAILGYVYAARLQRVWKGHNKGQIAFRLGFDSCPDKLKRNANYLIFAHRGAEGRLQLRGCDAFVPESEAVPLLARLAQLEGRG